MWHVCVNRAPREVRLAKTLPHFIAKGLDVTKQVSLAKVKVTGFLIKNNLPLDTGPLSKSIFPDSNTTKEGSCS